MFLFNLDLEGHIKEFKEKAAAAMPGSDWSPFEVTRGLPPERADIVIIGGGVIGWSIAYWLKNKNRAQDGVRVVVVEKDPTVSKQGSILFQQLCSLRLKMFHPTS